MNSIIIDLPNPDDATGKLKKAEHIYLLIDRHLEMKVARSITFWESDNTTPAIENPNSRLKQFSPVEVNGTTEGDWVDPSTGAKLMPTYDDQGNQTNNAIPELIYWQNIPLSKALPTLPQSVLDAIDKAGVKCSDVVYGLIKASILSDHKQGFY